MRKRRAVLAWVLAMLVCGVGATAAQALTHDWAIPTEVEHEGDKASEDETFAELGLSEAGISIGGGKGKAFKFSVPGLKSTIECKTVEGTGSLVAEGTDSLKASLSSCQVVENKNCKVTEPIAFSAKTEMVLVEKYFYYKMVPLTEGKPFATVQLTGVTCTLPKESNVNGAVASEISSVELVEQPLTMSEAISKKVNEGLAKESKSEYKLEFGKQAASIDAQLELKLTGEYGGRPWYDEPVPVLCETPNTSICPAGKAYPRDTTVKIVSEADSRFIYKLVISGNEIPQEAVCKTVTFEGKTALLTDFRRLLGAASTATYEECGGCSVTRAIIPDFIFTSTTPLAPGNGYLALNWMEVRIVCQGKICEYKLTPPIFNLTGGDPAKAERTTAVAMTRVDEFSEEGVCSATGTWQGVNGVGNALKFKLAAPKPVYLAY